MNKYLKLFTYSLICHHFNFCKLFRHFYKNSGARKYLNFVNSAPNSYWFDPRDEDGDVWKNPSRCNSVISEFPLALE